MPSTGIAFFEVSKRLENVTRNPQLIATDICITRKKKATVIANTKPFPLILC